MTIQKTVENITQVALTQLGQCPDITESACSETGLMIRTKDVEVTTLPVIDPSEKADLRHLIVFSKNKIFYPQLASFIGAFKQQAMTHGFSCTVNGEIVQAHTKEKTVYDHLYEQIRQIEIMDNELMNVNATSYEHFSYEMNKTTGKPALAYGRVPLQDIETVEDYLLSKQNILMLFEQKVHVLGALDDYFEDYTSYLHVEDGAYGVCISNIDHANYEEKYHGHIEEKTLFVKGFDFEKIKKDVEMSF